MIFALNIFPLSFLTHFSASSFRQMKGVNHQSALVLWLPGGFPGWRHVGDSMVGSKKGTVYFPQTFCFLSCLHSSSKGKNFCESRFLHWFTLVFGNCSLHVFILMWVANGSYPLCLMKIFQVSFLKPYPHFLSSHWMQST